MPCSIVRGLKPSTATNNLKWTIRFSCPSRKCTMLLRGVENTSPGNQLPKLFKRNKKTVICIQNNDDLCCARTLVSAKAIVDHHPECRSFKEGRKLQKQQAQLLHHEAQVPFGPCGYKELVMFSQGPSLYDYQIILVDADRAYHAKSFGPTQAKQLILLHEKDHYDVITSLSGFFNKGYICATWFKSYDHEGRHRCTKKIECGACRQKECPDFLHAYPQGLTATRRCHDCGGDFFGNICYEAHCTETRDGKTARVHQQSICFTRRRCEECFKLEVGLKDIERHRCGDVDCPSCHQYVDTQTHRCYIQRALTPQEIQELKRERKRKRRRQRGPPAKRGAAAGFQTLRANEEGEDNDDDEDDDDDEQKPTPLHVFFDIEAMQPQEQHVPNLIVAETEDDPRPFRFREDHCVREFLEWLDTLTLNETRPVNVIAHNFQGYDGYFVVHQYYANNQKVKQIRNGCKLLQVERNKIIRFIDSLSFFQMPLLAFPKTFGLTELRKGYLSHKLNIPPRVRKVASGATGQPQGLRFPKRIGALLRIGCVLIERRMSDFQTFV